MMFRNDYSRSAEQNEHDYGDWEIGVIVGYGEKSNPLVDQDDLIRYGRFQLSWFGEQWFFDNGDIGFTIVNNEEYTLNTVLRFNNSQSSFFNKDKSFEFFEERSLGVSRADSFADIADGDSVDSDADFADDFSEDSRDGEFADNNKDDRDRTASIASQHLDLELSSKPAAIEAGVEWIIDGSWGGVQIAAFSDVGNTHSGWYGELFYFNEIQYRQLSISSSLGLTYFDQKFNEYYWWGYEEARNLDSSSSLNIIGSISVRYFLLDNVHLSTSYRYEQLTDQVFESPIIEDRSLSSWFVGMGYQLQF